MAGASPFYRLETAKSHAVLRLEPAIGTAAWGDIEKVGSEVVASVGAQRSPAWLIDLSGLEYMGSALVALVVKLWKAVQGSGGKVVVVCGQGMPKEVLRLAGLEKLWTIVPTYEEGLRKLGVAGAAVESDEFDARSFPIISVLALMFAAVAGAVLAIVMSKKALDRDVAVAALYGCGGIAIALGLVSVFRERSWGRPLGGLVCLAAIAIAVLGFLNLPRSGAAAAEEPAEEGETAADETAETVQAGEDAAASFQLPSPPTLPVERQ